MTHQRVAVVTGTSTGFGALIAETLTRAGLRVFGTMRDVAGRNAASKAALEAHGVTVVEMDVTDQASVDRGAAAILAAAGGVDVLINNAGTGHMGVAEAFSPESLERQLAVNLVGPHRLDRAFLPGMRERGSGLVVFVSSVLGRFVIPTTGIYAASKWALEALAETMSYELRPTGVDVAIVEPGAYATNIVNVMIPPDDTARVALYPHAGDIAASLGAAPAGDPQEVADAVLALVNTPGGRRPLRTVVPAESPVAHINAASEPIQHATLSAFGLGTLLPAAPAAV